MQLHSSAALVVHNLDHAKRALEIAVKARTGITILSAPSAAALLGPRIFDEMISAAKSEIKCDTIEVDAAIDCGNTAGPALRAIKEGAQHILSSAASDVFNKISQIANASGTRITSGSIPALDLGSSKLTDTQLLIWVIEQGKTAHA